MNITKLVHSCVLIENNGKKILVDPGNYSWQNQTVKNSDFSNINSVVITHNHPDHFYDEFVKHVAAESPNAMWYGTQEVVSELENMGIRASTTSQNQDITFIESNHADLSPWFNTQPQHTSYVLFGDVLVSGDCQTLTDMHGARILASAINGGPWGGVVGFCKMVAQMPTRPQVVLPLHDWHWNQEARSAIYARLAEVLKNYDATFVPLENGSPTLL